MLIVDEPTNHLDIDARDALVKALADFEGAVVLITHDPHLVELVADRLWLVADGTVSSFDGDLDEYPALLAERSRGYAPVAYQHLKLPPIFSVLSPFVAVYLSTLITTIQILCVGVGGF